MSGVSPRARILLNASRPTVDQLENRRHLDSTPWNLSSGSLIQNWENTGLITTNDNWSGVPSIEGYFQTNTTGSNKDPQTVLTDTTPTLDINANASNPNTFSAGGVTEFALAAAIGGSGNGTVGMQGSGTAHETYLKLYLDNSSRTAPVRIKYDLIDIDGSATTGTPAPQQSFALQYRLATSGDYVNVPAGYVQNAADPALNATGLTTSFDVTLPNDTIGASIVQIRIMTTDSVGADQMVAVDNLRVFGSDVFAFQPATYTVSENVGTVSLTVKRIGNLNGTASVNYTLVNGSATSPSDFTAASGTLSFGDQIDTQTINVTIIDDNVAEAVEQFTASLSSPSAGFGVGPAATITINDNDTPIPTVVLNEIKVNPASADTSQEFVELRGTANAPLTNFYFVSIEGDGATASGTATMVVSLGSASMGSGGYLVIGSPSLTVAAGASHVSDARFDTTSGILQNGSNSFALIYSLTPISEGTDLDANSDGALELPAGASLIDAVGSLDGGVSDIAYGAILTQPSGAFGAASRFPDNVTPLTVAAWYNGDLLDPSLNGASETGVYDPRTTNSSANLPAGAVLTPGAANYPTGANAGAFVMIPIAQTVAESVGTVSIIVYRAGGAVGAASVTIGATGGTATSGSDYSAFTQTLNFADGEYQKTVTFTVNDDSDAELAETIDVQLSGATGSTILREGLGRVTISLSDPAPPASLMLNELDINPPGVDQPYEFVELRGTTSALLINVYLFSIEGSGTAAGTLDAIINLTGATVGSNGLLLVGANASPGFAPIDPNTGVFGTTLFDVTGGAGIENDSNTFMLVFVPVGVALPSTGTDYDVDNTGTLALDPGIVVIDSVASLDPDVGDIGYGGAVLPVFTTASGDAADALVRFPDNTTANSAAAWYAGNLDTTGTVQSQLNFGTLVSANFPVGGALTPGARNAPSGDTVAPTVLSSVFNFQTASAVPQSIVVTFSEDVGASLVASDFSLVNTDTNQVVNLSLAGVSGGGTIATLNFTSTGNPLGGSILKDGHYRIRVLAGQVADAAGNTLLANSDTPFAFKNADFDGDLDVDFDNLLTLAQNYGGTGKTFAQGDANYDGVVNFDDLLALAQAYNTTLFSSTPIAPRATVRRKGNDVLA